MSQELSSLLKKPPTLSLRVQQGISPPQKPRKSEIPFHIITRNDEPKEFFNKLVGVHPQDAGA